MLSQQNNTNTHTHTLFPYLIVLSVGVFASTAVLLHTLARAEDVPRVTHTPLGAGCSTARGGGGGTGGGACGGTGLIVTVGGAFQGWGQKGGVNISDNSLLAYVEICQSFKYQMCVSLTTEGLVPPGSDDHASVLTLVDVRLDGLTQHWPCSVQSTQVKQTVLEEALTHT